MAARIPARIPKKPPAVHTSPRIPLRLPSVALDRLEHLVRAASDQQLHCVIRFAGRVDAARLARAVRLTLDAEPVLGCRFVEHPRRPYWERLPDLDGREYCPYRTPLDPDAAIREYVARAIDLPAGPQVQARLFRSGDDYLCIKLNHAVADGGGVIEYAGLLGSIYRRLGEDRHYEPQPNLAGERGQGQVFRRIPLPGLLVALTRMKIPEPAWGIPSRGNNLSGRTVLVRRLGAERVAALRGWAKARGFTFNDVLLAALFRGLCAVLQPPAGALLPMQTPVNLRRYLPEGRAGALCNLAGSIYPALVYKRGASFEATVVAAHAAAAQAAAGIPGVGQALALEAAMALPYSLSKRLAASAMSRSHTGKSHPFLSNMGVIDPAWVDFGVEVVDAYGIGPVLYPPGFFLAVSTFRGVMTLATSFCHTAVDAGLIARCLDLTLAELPHGDSEVEAL